MNAHPQYPRRILLMVTGLTPQIVTETLYALAMRTEPPFVPTEMHLLTTVDGAERARLTLLSQDPGWFHRLCQDYGLSGIRFDAGHIHMLEGARGEPLDDIRDLEDNQVAADAITEHVRRLTSDPDSALHVSIAGGRKTMGFYAGYALSLYGRPQDRLSHVLVSIPYESNQAFYYPTPYHRVIFTQGPDSKPIDTRDAQVTLADIPFVRLRHGLPQALLEGRASFCETVAAVNRTLGPPELVIDLRGRILRAGGIDIKLPPADLAFYSWLARRCLGGKDPIHCPKDGVLEPEFAQEFLSEYRAILGPMGDDDRTSKCLAQGMDKMFFLERKYNVNDRLKAVLGPHADIYLICKYGRKPRTRYRMGVAVGVIRFGTAVE
jgi:CRISPR-associated protein (TIGR02584 family)